MFLFLSLLGHLNYILSKTVTNSDSWGALRYRIISKYRTDKSAFALSRSHNLYNSKLLAAALRYRTSQDPQKAISSVSFAIALLVVMVMTPLMREMVKVATAYPVVLVMIPSI
ncbi:hypothetical protein [Dolichospermum sp. UHCC 0315A]|jgi:uncharacterized membrane protein|uniref:hypothetical protein n=1 Tax=Dolichospermum sp. UHCC 0315A TaxID=1914871 RepID=UPI0011E78AEE|nr:hypothetical protein [Dolichospermum sp. UHCC 0315A]